MSSIKKSEVKAFMYKGRFKNKEEFWAQVEQKREERSELRDDSNMPNYSRNLSIRYEERIPEENFNKIRDIVTTAVGKPSHWEYYVLAGSPEKSSYDGWYYGEQYSSSYKYSKHIHKFKIYAPRKLVIQVEEFDGLYNVYCKKMRTTQGITIYKASWIIKRRGFEFDIQSGFVASNEIGSYHADTAKEAVQGLQKKIKREIRKILREDTKITIKKFRDITGACQAGCEDFIGKHNIPADVRMTVKEAIELLEEKGEKYYADKLRKAIK
jgi:hypothetical protein